MAGKDTVIHIQRYDGTWDILGQTVARGIQPDDPDLSVDEHGPKTASFTLRRTRGALWPDVRKYARVLIEVAGLDVWGGRVSDTPVKDDDDVSMSVQCEGAQAHMDDDVYERKYIVTDLSAWQDRRSNLATLVGSGGACASGQVSNDGGLMLMFAKDTTVAANDDCGVMLDMGIGGSAERIVFEGYSSANNNGTPQVQFYLLAGPSPSGLDATVLVGPQALTTLGAGFGPTGVDIAGHRYVFLVLHWNAGGSVANDAWVKFSSIQVFAESGYESGDASTLTLDTIAGDALDRASVLFDADRSLIEAPADPFYIPEFSFTEPRTPRQAVEAGNAFQDMQYGVDHRWRVFLRDRPALSAAEVEIGAWSGSQAEDQGDGDEIYSRCIVKASAPDGSPIRGERTQLQQPGVTREGITSPSIVNPGFETNTNAWLGGGSAITRMTSGPLAGSASGRWDNDGAGAALGLYDALVYGISAAGFSGTFRAGVTYGLEVALATNTGQFALSLSFGESGRYSTVPIIVTSTPTTFLVTWTPTADVAGSSVFAGLRVEQVGAGAGYVQVDSLALSAAQPTIIERAGFQRTKVIDASFMLTDASAQRIADTYLAGHKTSPFKGRRTLTGPRAVRNSLTGQYEGLERLLLRYGQPLMDTSAMDPDTGLPGRAGRIASVSYKPATDTAVVELDNSRANFEQLLERIGLVVGQGTR